jgi:hypothetical protein
MKVLLEINQDMANAILIIYYASINCKIKEDHWLLKLIFILYAKKQIKIIVFSFFSVFFYFIFFLFDMLRTIIHFKIQSRF